MAELLRVSNPAISFMIHVDFDISNIVASAVFTDEKTKNSRKSAFWFKNIRFDEFVALMEGFGFEFQRITGSHHIFAHARIQRPFPIQNVKGKAKPYQVEQLLKLVEEYDLRLEEE